MAKDLLQLPKPKLLGGYFSQSSLKMQCQLGWGLKHVSFPELVALLIIRGQHLLVAGLDLNSAQMSCVLLL